MKLKSKYIVITLILLVLILVSYHVYKNHNNKIYILNLKSHNKHLFFYGSRHSNDKNDPMFKDIKEYFYSTNPQIVLVEGDADKWEYYDIDSAIAQGESSYVAFLARKENILLKSVEPSQKEQFDYLLQKYDRNRVLAMYILRQTYQYQNQYANNQINYEQKIQSFVNYMMENGFPITKKEAKLDNLLFLLKQYTNLDINNNNWIELDVKAYVHRNDAIFNDIYNDVISFRNKNLILTIEDALNKYDRVFVIMGGGHLIEEKKEIEKIFNSITD